MRMTHLMWAVALAAPSAATAQDACEVAQPLSPGRLLRRTSLDLTQRVPRPAEIEAAEASGGVPPEQLDAFLGSEAFAEVLREHHAELLWPNLETVELVPQTNVIFPAQTVDGDIVYYSPLRGVFSRAVGDGNIFVPCRNEPAEFDADGHLVLEPVLVGTTTVAWAEGWVEVEPYWAPGTTVKVCGLDAQDSLTAPACPGPASRYPFAEGTCRSVAAYDVYVTEPFRGRNIDCGSAFGFLAPECGCGPNLQYCATPDVLTRVRDGFIEQQLRMVDRVARDGRPYEELLTSAELQWSGPLVHYMRYHAALVLDLYAGDPGDWSLPDLEYTDDGWSPSTATPLHAGVLTSPGYLLRFQANRMRAHRYYEAFECRSFAPSGPLPSPFEPCSQRDDLTERCGCDSCHVTLEPLAAHWGRFAEFGIAALQADAFPAVVGDNCRAPLETPEQVYRCIRSYNLDPRGEAVDYRGVLNAYVFRDPSEYPIIESGPSLRVESSIADGTIQSCVVRRLWTRLMHRPPTAEEAATVLPELAAEFDASGRRLDALVRAIVSHPAYGRTE